MSSHRIVPVLIVAVLFTAAGKLSAQDLFPEVENSKHSFAGVITANSVYVRSGPGDNYYPTLRLDQGAEVTVVGIRFDWLKIVPPTGSFSYVAKAFVDRNTDGSGTVNRDEVNVRTGSTLNAMKTAVQARLNKGDRVRILDERDEYYMIAPPADAYVYVHKQYLQPVRQLPAVGERPVARDPSPAAGDATQPAQREPDAIADATSPADAPAVPDADENTEPVSEIAEAQQKAEEAFDKLEAEFAVASDKPIEDQSIAEMLAAYQKLVADAALPESMRRIGEFRLAALRARADTREQFLAVRKMQEEARERQTALKAEQEELEQLIRKNDVQMFVAVGTLRTSSFQQGAEAMYRLTDPATGRTVVYLRTNDPKYASMIGKFVGVNGELSTDSQLQMRIVAPTEVVEIQPQEVFKSVAAQIVPASLIPQAPHASTDY